MTELHRRVSAPKGMTVLVFDGALGERDDRLGRTLCPEIGEHVTPADPRRHLSRSSAPPIRSHEGTSFGIELPRVHHPYQYSACKAFLARRNLGRVSRVHS